MPKRHMYPDPHPILTPASRESTVQVERTATGYAYRVNGGPQRHTSFGHAGYSACEQLDAICSVGARSAQEAASIAHLERELHEDLLALEAETQEREIARLYAAGHFA